MENAPSATPAAWYDDPSDPSFLRWWDGVQWTEHVQAKQPVAPPVAQAPIAPQAPAAPLAPSTVIAAVPDQLATAAPGDKKQKKEKSGKSLGDQVSKRFLVIVGAVLLVAALAFGGYTMFLKKDDGAPTDVPAQTSNTGQPTGTADPATGQPT